MRELYMVDMMNELREFLDLLIPEDWDNDDLDWLLNRAQQLCDRLSREVTRRKYPSAVKEGA